MSALPRVADVPFMGTLASCRCPLAGIGTHQRITYSGISNSELARRISTRITQRNSPGRRKPCRCLLGTSNWFSRSAGSRSGQPRDASEAEAGPQVSKDWSWAAIHRRCRLGVGVQRPPARSRAMRATGQPELIGSGRQYSVLARLSGAGSHRAQLARHTILPRSHGDDRSSFVPVVPGGPARVPTFTVRQPPGRRHEVDGPVSTLSWRSPMTGVGHCFGPLSRKSQATAGPLL